VADELLDRLAEPVAEGDMLAPFLARTRPAAAVVIPSPRRRRSPRNLAFADGLEGWELRGSFLRDATATHWDDYHCLVTDEHSALLRSAVGEPYGFADLRQAVLANDYRGRTVSFSGEFRARDLEDQGGLYVRVVTERSARESADEREVTLVGAGADWIQHGVSTQVPEDAVFVLFGITLTGRGQVELRGAKVVSGS
jgi:hypothetical protein